MWKSYFRPVIKENIACVVAACQIKVLLLWCAILNHMPWYYGTKLNIALKIENSHQIEYWSENNWVRNDIESWKYLACFQTYGTDV